MNLIRKVWEEDGLLGILMWGRVVFALGVLGAMSIFSIYLIFTL